MNSYIHKIFVHHNYVRNHFDIDISLDKKNYYRNLIITGKNGSGKSTLLRAINKELFQYKTGVIPSNIYYTLRSKFNKQELVAELEKLNYVNPKVELIFGKESDFINEDLLVIYIPTFRNISITVPNRNLPLNLSQALVNQSKHIQQLKTLNSNIANLQRNIINLEDQIENHKKQAKDFEDSLKKIQKDSEIKGSVKQISTDLQKVRTAIANKAKQISTYKKQLSSHLNNDSTINPYISLSSQFLQFLVDMKQKQAYAIADEETKNIKLYNNFFKKLEGLFKFLYEDPKLKLKHSFKLNKFFFEFKDGRTADFSQLADGFKSILVIIAEILLQKQAFIEEKNLEIDPSGIVLIDEIEAHLHLSLQEKIFPAITNFFPKLQFILATHSPQVCASDDNSYIYDISANHLEKNYLGGISYDVLSKAHFGLESEYSIETTKLLNKAKKLLSKVDKTAKDIEALVKLEESLTKISPELAYELVLFLRKNEVKSNDKY